MKESKIKQIDVNYILFSLILFFTGFGAIVTKSMEFSGRYESTAYYGMKAILGGVGFLIFSMTLFYVFLKNELRKISNSKLRKQFLFDILKLYIHIIFLILGTMLFAKLVSKVMFIAIAFFWAYLLIIIIMIKRAYVKGNSYSQG